MQGIFLSSLLLLYFMEKRNAKHLRGKTWYIQLLKKTHFPKTKNRGRAITISILPPNKYNLFLTAVSVCPESPTIRLPISKILHSKAVMFSSHNSLENLPSTCTPPQMMKVSFTTTPAWECLADYNEKSTAYLENTGITLD